MTYGLNVGRFMADHPDYRLTGAVPAHGYKARLMVDGRPRGRTLFGLDLDALAGQIEAHEARYGILFDRFTDKRYRPALPAEWEQSRRSPTGAFSLPNARVVYLTGGAQRDEMSS
jgi:hypothetical protein